MKNRKIYWKWETLSGNEDRYGGIILVENEEEVLTILEDRNIHVITTIIPLIHHLIFKSLPYVGIFLALIIMKLIWSYV